MAIRRIDTTRAARKGPPAFSHDERVEQETKCQLAGCPAISNAGGHCRCGRPGRRWLLVESKHRQADVAPVGCTTSQPRTRQCPAKRSSSFEKLKGRWLRAEGSYVVEVRSVEASGKMDAAYFNPRPINVAKAASDEGWRGTQSLCRTARRELPGLDLHPDPTSRRPIAWPARTFTPSPARTWMWTFSRLGEP